MPILLGSLASGGIAPLAPTIGTATAGDASATVTYTIPTWTGKGSGAVTYTATSSPGGFTGTGSSPITVSGLTNGTSYTFTVTATTSYGVTGPASAASNSVTPAAATSFDSIQTILPNGGSSTNTFSSIPQTYKHLQLRISGRDVGGNGEFAMYLNNDTTSTNYWSHYMYGDGASQYAGNSNQQLRPSMPYSSITASVFSVIIIDIFDYTDTNKKKEMRMFSGYDSAGGTGFAGITECLWNNTSAVNRIDCNVIGGTNWASGSVLALYGIKG